VPGSTGWTAVLLHSTGSDESELLDLTARLMPGTALLSPRGKASAPGGGNAFYPRPAGGSPAAIADIRTATEDVCAFVDEACARHRLDSGRLVQVGYSSGANVVLDILTRHPRRAHAHALLRPTRLDPDGPHVDLAGTPVLLLSAGQDERVGAEQSEAIAYWLARSGAALTALHDEQLDHGLGLADVVRLAGWLRGVTS
jgi:phospholipase/carboxylesterase